MYYSFEGTLTCEETQKSISIRPYTSKWIKCCDYHNYTNIIVPRSCQIDPTKRYTIHTKFDGLKTQFGYNHGFEKSKSSRVDITKDHQLLATIDTYTAFGEALDSNNRRIGGVLVNFYAERIPEITL